jgi:hypothetical protein
MKLMDADNIDRVAKALIDDNVESYEEALAELDTYTFGINVGEDAQRSRPLQAAVLTAVAAGVRCCRGGVRVTGHNVALMRPFLRYNRLCDAVESLGAEWVDVEQLSVGPVLLVGDSHAVPGRLTLRVTFDGWRGGVIPLERGLRLGERGNNAAAGVLAGAIAVSEVFQSHRGRRPQAGRRAVGLSLWRPGRNWLVEDDTEPGMPALPQKFWITGLGHLGQAYAWTIAQLPYERPEEVWLYLQDYDRAVDGNQSTGLLTTHEDLGVKKTRIVAHWLEELGFTKTTLIERKFAADFTRAAEDPSLALFGLDDDDIRTKIESVGFERVIDAGLGATANDALKIRVHAFPSNRTAEATFRARPYNANNGISQRTRNRPAYAKMLEDFGDMCGIDLIARTAVGLPFVGAVASTLVVAEAIRVALGEHRSSVIDVDLGSGSEDHRLLRDDVSPNVGITRLVANGGE